MIQGYEDDINMMDVEDPDEDNLAFDDPYKDDYEPKAKEVKPKADQAIASASKPDGTSSSPSKIVKKATGPLAALRNNTTKSTPKKAS